MLRRRLFAKHDRRVAIGKGAQELVVEVAIDAAEIVHDDVAKDVGTHDVLLEGAVDRMERGVVGAHMRVHLGVGPQVVGPAGVIVLHAPDEVPPAQRHAVRFPCLMDEVRDGLRIHPLALIACARQSPILP